MYSPKRNIRMFRSPAWMYSWRQSSAGPTTSVNSMSIDDTGLNGIFANAIGVSGQQGPYITRNSGTTWSQITNGITFASGVATVSCAVARSSPNVMYCGNSGGVSGGYIYKSTDYGSTWTELTSSGQRNWTGLACNSTGTIVFGAASGSGIYRSTDGGSTWGALANASGNTAWGPLCMSEDGNTIVVGTTNGSRLQISRNGMATTPTFGIISTVPIGAWSGISCSADGNVIFASSASSNVMCALSTDNGVTWRSGINPSGRANNTGYRRTACSLTGNRLIVTEGQPAVGGYIWVSQDGGVSWSDLAINNPNNWQGIAMTPNEKTIIAGTSAVSVPWVANGV